MRAEFQGITEDARQEGQAFAAFTGEVYAVIFPNVYKEPLLLRHQLRAMV